MHVVDHLGKGGLENGLVNLINGMDSMEFEHVVYAIRQLGANAQRLPPNVRVICQGKRDTDSRFQVGTFARAIRAVQPNIVHSRNWAGVEGVMAARLARCYSVHSEHGLEAAAETWEPKRRIWFRRLAMELAHRVFSVSRHLKELHCRRTGFNPGRIAVIHNGVDSQRFFPDPASRARMREELRLSADEFCIGCVGNLLPVKSQITVLEAIGELGDKLGNWRLAMIGEGPERAGLERFIADRGWEGRIQLLGTSERVPEFLNAMDLYILPSVAEGISNSLLEAMSTGLPVIASAVGGNLEVVEGDSGLLFEARNTGQLAERMLAVRTSDRLRQDLARRGVERVREHFSLRSMIRNYERLYEDVGATAAALPARVAVGR